MSNEFHKPPPEKGAKAGKGAKTSPSPASGNKLNPEDLMMAVTLAKLKAIELSEEVHLLGQLFLARSIGMIFGERGSGKSLLAMLICYAIAGMKALQPWGTGQGGVVCYLDGEMRIRGLRQRLSQLDAYNSNQQSKDEVGESFYVISRDLVSHPIGSIDTEQGQKAIDAMLPAHVDLIVIDNLSAWTSGGAEDVKSWQTIKAWLIEKRLRGIAVLILHHAGKGGAQRGTSAHEDLLDYSIQLRPHYLPDEPEKTSFTVEHTKLRDHLPELKRKYVFSVWTAPETETMKFDVTPYIGRSEALLNEIVALQKTGLTQTKIAEKLGVHKSVVSRTLKQHRLESKDADAPDEDEPAPDGDGKD